MSEIGKHENRLQNRVLLRILKPFSLTVDRSCFSYKSTTNIFLDWWKFKITNCVPETKGKTIRWVFYINIRTVEDDVGFEHPKNLIWFPIANITVALANSNTWARIWIILSEIQKYFIGAAATDDTEGDYVDKNRQEKMKALLSFCQNWSFYEWFSLQIR